jgi:hypothetical protein
MEYWRGIVARETEGISEQETISVATTQVINSNDPIGRNT